MSQKVYQVFLAFNASLRWLNNVSCFFVIPANHKWSIIVNWYHKSWLASSLYCMKSDWRYIGRFPPALAYNVHNPPANGKQGPIPEEMSQTLLTSQSQIPPWDIPLGCETNLFRMLVSSHHRKTIRTASSAQVLKAYTILFQVILQNLISLSIFRYKICST